MINLSEGTGFNWEMTNDIYHGHVTYKGRRYGENITIKSNSALIYVYMIRPYDEQEYVYAYIDIIRGKITYYIIEGTKPKIKWTDTVSKLVPKFNGLFDTDMPNDADSVQALLSKLDNFDQYPDEADYVSEWITEIEEFAIKRLDELNKDYKPRRAIW